MKVIPVKIPHIKASKPMFVDDWDFEILSKLKWHLTKNGYARSRLKYKTVSAHKLVIWAPDSKVQTDHINHNRLDKYIGTFPTPLEAHLAYREAAKKYHGAFACFD